MKKILILTVTAGNGHNACAKAMKEKLENSNEIVEVKIVDVLKTYSTPFNVWLVDKGYSIAIGKLPHLYEFFYEHYRKKNPKYRFKCAGQNVAMEIVTGLYKEINEFKPDVIYCTHFYCGIAITDLRLVYDIPCKVIITSLDYVHSPFWEACINVDYFVVPNEDFILPSLKLGFKREQIKPFGIPVNEKFYGEIDKKFAREKLNIDSNLFTIMIMYGGGQWGGGFKIFKKVLWCFKNKDKKVQIVMINGRNEKDYKKINKMKFPKNIKVVNVGFTNQVDLYMSASDLIISKLGGLSATESINKKLPALITPKVYAQEKHNLIYLSQKGAVKSYKNKHNLKEIIYKMMNDNNEYTQTIKGILKLRKNAIEDLSKLILEQPNAIYDDSYINKIDYSNVKKNVIIARNKQYKLDCMKK